MIKLVGVGVGYKKRTNIMSSLLWLLVVLASIFSAIIYTAKNTFLIWFFAGIIASVVAFSLCVFWYFLKNDPDRLQSEEYNIESRKIALGHKAEPPSIEIINPASVIIDSASD